MLFRSSCALTAHVIRDQYATNAGDLDLNATDIHRPPRPSDMTDDFAVTPSEYVDGVRRIPIRRIGVPLTEVILVLGVEEPAKRRKVAGG